MLRYFFMIKIIKIIELLLHKYINYDMVNIYQYIKLNIFAKEGAMHTEVHNAVTAADQGAQYDESAKRLLGQKSILAQILVRTVDEFK